MRHLCRSLFPYATLFRSDLCVVGREPQRPFGDADAACGDIDAPELEPAGCLIEALPFDLADQVVGGDPIVVEKDRKSTRLNSSHLVISYAVFCLIKKKML